MNQTKGKTKSASQNPAAVIHQNSTNARHIAHEIKVYAKSRSACIRRQQWLREQIARLDAALESQPAKETAQRCRKFAYGELTSAVKEELQGGALPKLEIVARLQKKNILHVPNPLKTVDSVLYTAHFKRNGNLFSLTNP